MPTNLFILAGEPSGDLHAASLVAQLKKIDPTLQISGMGGERMRAAGVEILKDLEGMQVIGFWEVAKQYGFFKRVFYELVDQVKQRKPAAVICVDYPGFNLRFAAEMKRLGIPVLYYIVPQVWAWKPMRAKKMAQMIEKCFCVFEFEIPFFQRYGVKAEFVGHPLMDTVPRAALPLAARENGEKIVAILPGSRENEFAALTRPMMDGFHLAREKTKNLSCLISVAPELREKHSTIRTLARAGIIAYSFEVIDELKEHFKKLDHHSEKFNDWLRDQDMNRYKNLPPLPALPKFRTDPIHTFPDSKEIRASLKHLQTIQEPHSSLLPRLADFSVVKSGTSTLEAGLAGNPLCVVYRGSAISYALAHLLVDIPVFSLINIVLGRYVVPELLQYEVNPARIAAEIERGLTDERYREKQKAALAELPGRLGGPGASKRTAEAILKFVRGR